MTMVIASEECGNSPKNIFAQELTIAFARVDSKFLLESVTDNIRWNNIGGKIIEGKEGFAKALKQSKKATELIVHHVSTHGRSGLVNGILKLADHRKIAFCHVYEFGNTKGIDVNEITSYMIEIT